MNLILKSARIINPESNFHNQTIDIKIANGIIIDMGENLKNSDKYQEIILENLHISNGWFDTSVSLGEPGFEERETIENGLNVAAKSGFTGVALQPNCYPVLDNQSQINFVKNKAVNHATQLYPIGSLTQKSEGIDLAELFDMKNSGAIGFGDYNKNIENSNLLKIALQYCQDFDGLVIAFCQENSIKGKGIVNEGKNSTQYGLKGIPSLAEEIALAKVLFILEYTGGKIHIPTISSAKSVELIKNAKSKGMNVTCSVAVHNLIFNDDVIQGFDSNFKVLPPIRTENDRKSLVKAVLDNTIDCITSDHNPIDIENKKIEFDHAKNGTIGLENAFSSLMTILPLETIIKKFLVGKSIFGIKNSKIEVGHSANLTFFNPEGKWIFTKESINSKSKNSAFLNTNLQGKVYGIYNQGKLILKN